MMPKSWDWHNACECPRDGKGILSVRDGWAFFFRFPLLRDRNIETEIVKIVKRRVHIDLQQENFAVNQGNGRI